MTIEVRIDELLNAKGRSFYWLSKQTSISYTTLWRLKKGKALGINFATLEKLCHFLLDLAQAAFIPLCAMRTRNALAHGAYAEGG